MNLIEVERAVAKFSTEDFEAFRNWFADFEMSQWDKEIEEDSKAGRLDAMLGKAMEDYRAGRASDL